MPQLKLSLRSSLAPSYICVEPGFRYPWWYRFVSASRLASSGRRKNSSAARRARSTRPASIPWFRTYRKPVSVAARASSAPTPAGSAPSRKGATSITGTSPASIGTALVRGVMDAFRGIGGPSRLRECTPTSDGRDPVGTPVGNPRQARKHPSNRHDRRPGRQKRPRNPGCMTLSGASAGIAAHRSRAGGAHRTPGASNRKDAAGRVEAGPMSGQGSGRRTAGAKANSGVPKKRARRRWGGYASTHLAPSRSDATQASMKRIPATPSCTPAAGQGARPRRPAGARIQPATSP